MLHECDLLHLSGGSLSFGGRVVRAHGLVAMECGTSKDIEAACRGFSTGVSYCSHVLECCLEEEETES